MKEIYKGSQLLYSSGRPSYLILANGTQIDFEMGSNPLSNFTSSIKVNGTSINASEIKELHFGESYDSYTGILTNNFARYYTNIEKVTLPININGIGLNTFYGTNTGRYVTRYEIPRLVTEIYSLLGNASGLIELVCRPIIPPSGAHGVYPISDYLPNLKSSAVIKVPAESVAAYKAHTSWSSLASRIVAI